MNARVNILHNNLTSKHVTSYFNPFVPGFFFGQTYYIEYTGHKWVNSCNILHILRII